MSAYRDTFKQFNGKSFSLLGEAHMEKLAGNSADGKLIYLRLQEAKRNGRSSAYSSSPQGSAVMPLKYAPMIVARCAVHCSLFAHAGVSGHCHRTRRPAASCPRFRPRRTCPPNASCFPALLPRQLLRPSVPPRLNPPSRRPPKVGYLYATSSIVLDTSLTHACSSCAHACSRVWPSDQVVAVLAQHGRDPAGPRQHEH
jgi:hypothetical protein